MAGFSSAELSPGGRGSFLLLLVMVRWCTFQPGCRQPLPAGGCTQCVPPPCCPGSLQAPQLPVPPPGTRTPPASPRRWAAGASKGLARGSGRSVAAPSAGEEVAAFICGPEKQGRWWAQGSWGSWQSVYWRRGDGPHIHPLDPRASGAEGQPGHRPPPPVRHEFMSRGGG